jgi:hypothetical protein
VKFDPFSKKPSKETTEEKMERIKMELGELEKQAKQAHDEVNQI